jgi:hypothetical protein
VALLAYRPLINSAASQFAIDQRMNGKPLTSH